MISVSGFALRRRDEGGVWPSSSDAGGQAVSGVLMGGMLRGPARPACPQRARDGS